MICNQCGKEFAEGLFCPYCGKNQNKVIKAGKKTLWIVWLILGLVVVAGLCIFGIFLIQKEEAARSEKFLDMLKHGEMEEASELYQSKIVNDDEKVKETYSLVKSDIEGIVEDFYGGSISYDDAITKLNVYAGFYDTDVETATNKLDLLRESRNTFEKAEEEFKNEKYKEAMSLYSEVIDEDQNYETALKKQKECYEAIKSNILINAEGKASEGKYSEAISILQSEYDFLSDDKKELDEKIGSYKQIIINESIKKAKEYLNNEEFVSGVNYIGGLSDYVRNDEEVKKIRSEMVKGYEDEVVAAVEAYKEVKAYTEAIQFVRNARNKMPGSTLISGLEDELKDYLPISLSEVAEFDCNLSKQVKTYVTDRYQNEYEEAFCYYHMGYGEDKEKDHIFLLKGGYEHFSATFVASPDWREEGDFIVLSVFTDGIKLKEMTIYWDTRPIEFDVDVTGVEQLDLKFNFTRRDQSKYFMLGNPLVYKKY